MGGKLTNCLKVRVDQVKPIQQPQTNRKNVERQCKWGSNDKVSHGSQAYAWYFFIILKLMKFFAVYTRTNYPFLSDRSLS
jgi:hypothetical protein